VGVGECPADDQVDLVDGLRCEPLAVGGVLQALVERFELLEGQPADPDAAERGQDVVLDVAFVAPVAARR
jgi:hypothetical protein